MALSRRRLLGSAALLGLVAGCAPPVAGGPETSGPAPPVAPPGDPEALIGWIAARREHVSLSVDDGRGAAFDLDAHRQRPIASATKVVHLLAYAQAVVAGRLDPAAPVTRAEWERWYVPGTDGFAHPTALKDLGVGPDGNVTWDDLVRVMIDYSDSAAPDLLRGTLGGDALVAAAAAGGWAEPDLPAYGGQGLLGPAPYGTGGLPVDTPAGPERRAREWAAIQAYSRDPAERAEAARRGDALLAQLSAAPAPVPTPEDVAAEDGIYRWYAGSATGSAAQLAGIHRAIATAEVGEPVAAIARRHLGRQLAPQVAPPIAEFGQKGGNLPGLVANAFSVRRTDGSVGVSTIALSDLPPADYAAMLSSAAPLVLSQQVLLDDALRERLRTAVGAG